MLKIILLTIITQQITAQILFPDDEKLSKINLTNLIEIRGSHEYETTINNIISNGITKLTLNLENALDEASNHTYNSIVYSPVNIAAALSLVLLGANGETFNELAELMGLTIGINLQNRSEIVHQQFGRMIKHLEDTTNLDENNQISLANGIFLQNEFPIRNVYKTAAETYYKSEIIHVDFKRDLKITKNIIDTWVSDRTNGKITKLLNGDLDPDTKIILASAMYFKAKWEFPFMVDVTSKRAFYPDGHQYKNKRILVDMMANVGDFPYYSDNKLMCEILGLPYKGNQTTMYVILPRNSSRTRLEEFKNQLTNKEILRLINSVRYEEVAILFPKMHIESTLDLEEILAKMGIKTLFDPNKANLALLSSGSNGESRPQAANSQQFHPPQPQQQQEPSSIINNKGEELYIFNRNKIDNCTEIFEPTSNLTKCQDNLNTTNKVVYKKFDNKVGRRVTNRNNNNEDDEIETLDKIRKFINQQNNPELYENPHLYVTKVIHKIYMDITESGTEAAASTAISTSRIIRNIPFRVDVPFLFFIVNEETKTILFWGSVHQPTPHY